MRSPIASDEFPILAPPARTERPPVLDASSAVSALLEALSFYDEMLERGRQASPASVSRVDAGWVRRLTSD